MLNFAVGPVMMDEQTLSVAAQQIPYFRTEDFSSVVKKCEANIKNLMDADNSARVILMTGSGTASMEATMINVLSANDRAIIVNGGSFGERFCKICAVHGIEYMPINCEYGKSLTEEQLSNIDCSKYSAFIVNLCETSTGVLYDIDLIHRFCKENDLLLIVDAVSAFLCDEFSMRKHGIDVVITGSQKALGLAPGLSIMCFSNRAIQRVNENAIRSFYFNLKSYLLDGERGQTPFTPAVGIILQLFEKTNRIIADGGISNVLSRAKSNADFFRNAIVKLPFKLFADKKSNSVTAIEVSSSIDAYNIFLKLKSSFGITICPNGGELKNKVFRVGHMGNLTQDNYIELINALKAVL